MSIELVLARFGEGGGEAKSSNNVGHLSEAVQATLRERKRLEIETSLAEDTLLVDLPGGTAEIHADHAIFPIEMLDRLTVAVVFALAKAGNFVVLPEGGRYPAILFDPRQRSHLPDDDWKDEEMSPVCRSPDELAQLLESWFHANAEFRVRAIKRFFDSE